MLPLRASSRRAHARNPADGFENSPSPTSARRGRQRNLLVCAYAWIAWSASPALALIVTATTLDTTQPPQPPADNPGWDNVTVGASTPNYTYLGNGWALSAYHVGTGPVTFSTGTFSAIPGQVYEVPNPAGSGLSAVTDLQLIRLNGDPGLPSLTIASQSLTESIIHPPNQLAAEVTIIGQGRTRQPNLTNWDANWVEVPSGGAYQGYWAGNDVTKRWGKNQLADEDSLFSTNDNDLRGTVNLSGLNRDVVSMFTQFDQSGIQYEAQAADRDSGSAVFRKNGSQWELIGVVNTVYTYQNQPALAVAFTTYTSFADLTYYRNEIFDIMNAHTNYSVMGDVNLDGVVSGNGTGSAATDDVAAFVQGWNWHQATADVESWKRGDLNLDGTTNVADFFLMRGALTSAGLSVGVSTLSTLFNPSVVPEPTAVALLFAAAGFALTARRRP
ncbi:MAG: PEP-CTERM sorting domain-containing protein [Pirellulales bacterium]|nr:PEP-CTERM sorting domain-containing protein [Pirellulales bacterium]